jgi:4-diphosphocytidyl-2-C-methyl-D-erythritol kinase
MIVFPNAKINLGLRILRKRPDGFHDLESAFLPVGLTDMLEIVPAAGDNPVKLNPLTVTGIPLKATDDNLCIRAHRLLWEKHGIPSVKLHLHKKIPTGAGLGGGSSDAAFTLLALNKMFGLSLDVPVLKEYALMIGSDCPFFILNQPSLATGRGEQLEPLHVDLSGYTIVLVLPGIMVDTAMAYKMIIPEEKGPAVKEVIRLAPEEWNGRLVNHFELPVIEKYPEIGGFKQALYDSGAVYASMSGSGSAVFGLFRDTPDLPAEINRCPLYIERFS